MPLVGEDTSENFEGARFARAVMDDIERRAVQEGSSHLKCMFLRERVETAAQAQTLLDLRGGSLVVWGFVSIVGDTVMFRPRITSASSAAKWPMKRVVPGGKITMFEAAVSGLQDEVVRVVQVEKRSVPAYRKAASDTGHRALRGAAEPRLEIRVYADRTSVVVGGTVTYTVVLLNAGDGPASNCVVRNMIPRGTQYVPGSLTLDGKAVTESADADAARVEITETQLRLRLGEMPSQTARFARYKVVVR